MKKIIKIHLNNFNDYIKARSIERKDLLRTSGGTAGEEDIFIILDSIMRSAVKEGNAIVDKNNIKEVLSGS